MEAATDIFIQELEMDNGKPLAKFRHPPLIEVVHGVQFAPLPMTIIHPGLFYARIQDKYPQTQTQPPLAPARETFENGPQMFLPFGFFPQGNLPRTWFVSKDDTLLIQLQSDRLLLNWRRGLEGASYPHFETVSEEFRRIYRGLEAFAIEQGLGPIQPNQCEMTYINHLKADGDVSGFDPGYFFNVWRDPGDDWNEPLEDMAFNMRFLMRDENGSPIGRLTANFVTMSLPNIGGEKVFQLDLTARGAPSGDNLPAVLAFHEKAHAYIVRCFAGITTTSAQQKWERLQ